MKLILDINRAKFISKELNLSDIKILFNLTDYMDQSGFVVLTPKVKYDMYIDLSMTRQTFHNSINRLYSYGFLLYSNGKTYYNDELILIK